MKSLENLLDLIDHPERYSREEIEALLAEQENREYYNLICKTQSAVKAGIEVDAEAEWRRFSERHRPRRRFFKPANRAASIAVAVFVSIASVAAGIGIGAMLRSQPTEAEARGESVEVKNRITEIELADTTSELGDNKGGETDIIVFENKSLREILDQVAYIYNAEVVINNEEAGELKLFFKLDPALPLKEVADRLDTFGQINVDLNGNTITVN